MLDADRIGFGDESRGTRNGRRTLAAIVVGA
jgi:hypothetical protein